MFKSPSFAEAIAVQAVDSHTYTGFFPPEWCVGNVPNGGYVTSCILSVTRLHFSTTLSSLNQPHTLTVQLSFLRRTSTGPVTFKVKDIKLGRQTSNVHITLTQASGTEEVVGYIIQSNMIAESGLSLPTKWSLSPPPYPADVSLLSKGDDRHWKLQDEMPFSAFRRASSNVQFYLPRSGHFEKSMIDEWIRFSNGEKFTMESLGFVADMFPQIVEAYRNKDDDSSGTTWASAENSQANGNLSTAIPKNQWAQFWYPTLLLNLDVKKILPSEGVEWFFLRVRTKQIKNGRYDLEVVILDQEGDLVALSNHVALIVSSERNMAERKKGGVAGSHL